MNIRDIKRARLMAEEAKFLNRYTVYTSYIREDGKCVTSCKEVKSASYNTVLNSMGLRTIAHKKPEIQVYGANLREYIYTDKSVLIVNWG